MKIDPDTGPQCSHYLHGLCPHNLLVRVQCASTAVVYFRRRLIKWKVNFNFEQMQPTDGHMLRRDKEKKTAIFRKGNNKFPIQFR